LAVFENFDILSLQVGSTDRQIKTCHYFLFLAFIVSILSKQAADSHGFGGLGTPRYELPKKRFLQRSTFYTPFLTA
jgi:hypothetical protein